MTIEESMNQLRLAYMAASLVCGEGMLPPASDEAINRIETELGMPVPKELRDVLRLHGGQDPSDNNSGFFGRHFLLSPERIVETHKMHFDNYWHFISELKPEFPPLPGTWGYWVPDLIPFASWDTYDLCIHSRRGDVWDFCPNIGLTEHRANLSEVLRELQDAVQAGREPELTHEKDSIRGE